MDNIKCSLETRTSKKGNDYQVLVIKLTDSYEKLVFLEPAEIELLKFKKNDNFDFPNI